LTILYKIKAILIDIGKAYLESVIKRFNEYKSLGDKTFAQLLENDFFFQPNDASNSIAVIIQHMHGNMLSRWTNFLTEDGEKDWRQRDEEFEIQDLSRDQLIQRWEEGWNLLFHTLDSLTTEDLLKQITIRQQPLIVVDAINRQLAHYSSHVGQIVYLGKWSKGMEWSTLSMPKKSPAQ
jgi:hypothetical protein